MCVHRRLNLWINRFLPNRPKKKRSKGPKQGQWGPIGTKWSQNGGKLPLEAPSWPVWPIWPS